MCKSTKIMRNDQKCSLFIVIIMKKTAFRGTFTLLSEFLKAVFVAWEVPGLL